MNISQRERKPVGLIDVTTSLENGVLTGMANNAVISSVHNTRADVLAAATI